MTRVLAATAAAVVVGGGAAGCGFADNRRPGPGVPPYEAFMRSDNEIDVLTNATSPGDLEVIFEEVVEDRSNGHWWEVTISCSAIPETEGVDARLAVGRFANTHRGVAEGDLEGTGEAHAVFELTGRTDCDPLGSTVPGTVTAEDVFAIVEGAGLSVVSPRDGSDACRELGCLRRTVTDQFVVIVWPEREAAERWAATVTLDAVHLGPVTTVQLVDGGFDPAGSERDRYWAALTAHSGAGGSDAEEDGPGAPPEGTESTGTTIASSPGA